MTAMDEPREAAPAIAGCYAETEIHGTGLVYVCELDRHPADVLHQNTCIGGGVYWRPLPTALPKGRLS